MAKLRVGVAGGSGYGGAELLRILLGHPAAEVVWASAGERAGKRVDEVYPNLRGLTDLVFGFAENWEGAANLDCLFLALPHGHAMAVVPRLRKDLRVIDLSGDFRLSNPGAYLGYYGKPHTAMEFQPEFVYGLTEIHRRRVGQARRVACPGCFATATLIGLAPLAASGAIEARVVVDAKTGSSGSGAKPADNTHHPTRANSFYAYKPFSHQHLPEIAQALGQIDGELGTGPDWERELIFQTHSAPIVRGISTSIYCRLRRAMSAGEIRALFEDYYRDCFFVRLVGSPPNVNWVKNSNFADVGWAVRDGDLIVFTAIDNLVKGASGQAVQNMNLMHGLPEQAGLDWPGSCP